MSKYFDDVLSVTSTLERGAKCQIDGIEAGRTKQEITYNVLKSSSNDTTPFLRFTGEVATDERGIPVLDTRISITSFCGGN